MTDNNITYSVIMPVYNGRKYFGAALQSALTTLGEDDEIVVIEDGSQNGGTPICLIVFFAFIDSTTESIPEKRV